MSAYGSADCTEASGELYLIAILHCASWIFSKIRHCWILSSFKAMATDFSATGSQFTSKKTDVPGLTSLGRGFQSATPGTCAGVEERVTKYTGHYDGEAEADSQTKQRSENAAEISTSYYNLVTDFFRVWIWAIVSLRTGYGRTDFWWMPCRVWEGYCKDSWHWSRREDIGMSGKSAVWLCMHG